MLLLAISLVLAHPQAGTRDGPVDAMGDWSGHDVRTRSRGDLAGDRLYDCYTALIEARNVTWERSDGRIHRLDLVSARICGRELREYRRRFGARAAGTILHDMFEDYWGRL